MSNTCGGCDHLLRELVVADSAGSFTSGTEAELVIEVLSHCGVVRTQARHQWRE